MCEAHRADEAKDIPDKARSLALYAQQIHDREMITWAMAIRFRAERGFGDLLKEKAEKKQRRGRGKP